MISNLAGLIIPLDDGTEGAQQKMKDDQNWLIVYIIPVVFEVFSIVIIFLFYKNPSVINLLEREDEEAKEQALVEIRKIYTVEAPMTHELLAAKLKK